MSNTLVRVSGILTYRENEQLSRVATTAAEAAMILERNLTLLSIFAHVPSTEALHDVLIPLGCPHCLAVGSYRYQCRNCAWRFAESSREIGSDCCGSQGFGGVSLHTVDFVWFGSDSAGLDSCAIRGKYSSAEVRYLRVLRFLLGHIEWAQIVLEREGVSWDAIVPRVPLRDEHGIATPHWRLPPALDDWKGEVPDIPAMLAAVSGKDREC